MTPNVTPRHVRGASLAIGGMFVVASTMLVGTPTAGAAPSTDAVKAIDDHYPSVSSVLGQASGEATDIAGGAEKDYAEGAIFYSKETGAKAMYGEIFKKYQAVGGPAELGFPTNDESGTGDGMGRFNEFAGKDGETNAIFWGPNTGAWVMRGKVYDAWKASGGITGPFGYPKDDTTSMGDTWTSNFVGPDGTQISWSKAAGLVTLPAALAGKINLPGIGSATTSVTKPSITAEAPAVEKKGGFKWWWLLPLLLLALIPFLLKLFRKPEPEPVRVTTPPPVKKVVTPPPPPVKKVVAPPPPPRPAPKPPVPPAPKPVVKTPPPPAPKPVTPPPPPPRPVVPEAPKLVERVEHKVEHVVEKVEHKAEHVAEKVERFVEAPKATIREAHIEHETSPVIRYETHTPAETTIQVTYENNAVDGKESRADKSDLTPDYLQE